MSESTETSCQTNEGVETTVAEASSNPVFRPHYTSRYDQESWHVAVTLPGVKKENISVTVENDLLEVVATRRLHAPAEWRPLGNFAPARSYRLRLDVGPEVDEKLIAGTLEDGILNLRLPLREDVKPRVIEIK